MAVDPGEYSEKLQEAIALATKQVSLITESENNELMSSLKLYLQRLTDIPTEEGQRTVWFESLKPHIPNLFSDLLKGVDSTANIHQEIWTRDIRIAPARGCSLVS